MAPAPHAEHAGTGVDSGSVSITIPQEASSLPQYGTGPPIQPVAPPPIDRSASKVDRSFSQGLQRGYSARAGECRICLLSAEEADEVLLNEPCGCTGSVNKVHYSCLAKWVLEKRSLVCELCKQQYHEPTYSRLKAHIEEHAPPGEADTYILFAAGGTGASTYVRPMPQPYSWQNIMCHVVVLCVLVAVILYLTVFSDIAPSMSSDWTAILWRVLTILIPAYLVGRLMVLIFMRWRYTREVRRQQALQQAQTEEAMRTVAAIEAGLAEVHRAELAAGGGAGGAHPPTRVVLAELTPTTGGGSGAGNQAGGRSQVGRSASGRTVILPVSTLAGGAGYSTTGTGSVGLMGNGVSGTRPPRAPRGEGRTRSSTRSSNSRTVGGGSNSSSSNARMGGSRGQRGGTDSLRFMELPDAPRR